VSERNTCNSFGFCNLKHLNIYRYYAGIFTLAKIYCGISHFPRSESKTEKPCEAKIM